MPTTIGAQNASKGLDSDASQNFSYDILIVRIAFKRELTFWRFDVDVGTMRTTRLLMTSSWRKQNQTPLDVETVSI